MSYQEATYAYEAQQSILLTGRLRRRYNGKRVRLECGKSSVGLSPRLYNYYLRMENRDFFWFVVRIMYLSAMTCLAALAVVSVS